MRRVFLFLIGCFLTLTLLPLTASAEENHFRVGLVGEYANTHYGKGGTHRNAYGTDFGLLLGYENTISDDLWFKIDGKIVHGPRTTTTGISPWRNTDVRTTAKIGTSFHYGVDIKPFVGVGVNYTDRDIRDSNDEFFTDYIVPVGVSFEKETDYGLIGSDIQYEYVVYRERHTTDANQTGTTQSFGGNGNLEIGLFFEPKGTSMGFRPYYRYEHENYKERAWWPTNTNIGGLEIYYRF